MIQDSFGRVHDYLRISLTDNCNLRCFYCMPEEEYDFAASSALMQLDEIVKIATIFVEHGVKKIRLTGGEPLVRKDASAIISALAQLPVQLTMTTNGARLHEFKEVILQSGIKSINISLDTLQADKFLYITRRNIFQQVMQNIDLMLQEQMHVKINVVVMKGLNGHEINDFIAWTQHRPVHVRFIEFMPFSGNKWSGNQVFTWQEILNIAREKYNFTPLEGKPNDTAKSYQVIGHQGTFSVISTMSAPFCSTCNRMRLTADGKLKNCLFSKGETDLLGALRAGLNITPLILDTIYKKEKALGGQLKADFAHLESDKIENRSMITIGG